MKCEIIRDLLPLYADGLASEESVRVIEEHLKSCSECAALAKRMCDPMEPEAELNQEAYDCIKEIDRQNRKNRIKNVLIGVLTAAILAVIGFNHWKTYHYVQREIWKEEEMSAETALEEMPELALTDGEKALSEVIFRVPELEKYRAFDEFAEVSYELVEKYMNGVIPEGVSALVYASETLFYVDYFHNDKRIIIKYADGDHTGYGEVIEKYISVMTAEREVEAVYHVSYDVASGETVYEKSQAETPWYDFLIPD